MWLPEFPGFANSALEWLTVVLDFLARVAWPLSVLTILWTLARPKNRDGVQAVLTGIARSVRMLKIGDLEAHFDAKQSLDKIKSYVEGKGGRPVPPSGIDSHPQREEGHAPEGSEKEAGREAFDETSAAQSIKGDFPLITTVDPRMAVLEAYEMLENGVREAVRSLPEGNRVLHGSAAGRVTRPLKMMPFSSLLRIAQGNGLVTHAEYRGLDEIRRMRNAIAHSPGSVKLSPEAAMDYAEQCETLAGRIAGRAQRLIQPPLFDDLSGA